jgi:hypothetical protein
MKKTMNDIKKEQEVETQSYGFYSRVLDKVFDTVESLKDAEAAYAAEQKAKEDKAAQKKAEAKKVEDAFKALNLERKMYKENILRLTERYSEDLKKLRESFDADKKAVEEVLADAEASYAKALKAFTDAHPEGYHLTLKDGDFETTISSQSSNKLKSINNVEPNLLNLFDFLFKI